MDRLKKARTPVRASFTKTYNMLLDSFKDGNPDQDNLQKLLVKLDRVNSELTQLDGQVLELILDGGSDEEYSNEHSVIEEYQDKLSSMRYDVNVCISRINQDQQPGPDISPSEISGISCSKRKFKLPKLEWHRFNGDIKEWLGFWSQFRKIHEDDDIVLEDKFQYLIQATVKESRARELVESFPPTAENYPKVIDSLKSRFGRDDLLVEVYVRELLKLVIQNVSPTKEKSGMAKLYDRLESHLRSLESIGVTSEKYTAMLFPLVESCLPEEILRAWQRKGASGLLTGGKSEGSKGRLSELMQFLRSEVEGEERILLARAGFGPTNIVTIPKSKKREEQGTLSTAAGLFSGNQTVERKQSCIFCDKQHESKECFTAQKMTLLQKRELLSKRKVCFACFKPSHLSKVCKASVRCPICCRRHHVLMCPDLPAHKVNTAEKSSIPENTEVALANHSRTDEVLLQTLKVNIKGGNKQRTVRALIDTGSQKSYIRQCTVKEMGYEALSKETVIHSLFGGLQSTPHSHQKYKISLGSLDGSFSCNFEVLDQPDICGDIPRIQGSQLQKLLLDEGIRFSDYGGGCPPIEILIGADIAGKLLTGQLKHLKNGLVAVETRLGWTIMGRIPGKGSSVGVAMNVTSMLIHNASITDLWNLEVLGIKEISAIQTKDELESLAKDHFLQTVQHTKRGRYEIHLPWTVDNNLLPSNRNLCEKRLCSMSNRLNETGHMPAYNKIFEDWLSHEIIEEVPTLEIDNPGHYLPHRAVLRPKSLTTPVRPVFDASAREKNCPSLNDCLQKGPNLLELIPVIMMRFREKRIGVVSDIRKAFLQIEVRKEDQDFLRFLWWEDYGAKRIKVFRHRRVVFGVNCSPFLLAAVIELHLKAAPSELKSTAEKLGQSLYVDNCLASVDNEEDMHQFIVESQLLMASAGFDLAGWEHGFGDSKQLGEPVSALGLLWNKGEDTLQCDLRDLQTAENGLLTKRTLLSATHRVFDPIGFTCPVMVTPKRLLQETWELKIGWDTALPEDFSSRFIHWREELPQLMDVKIPRWSSVTDLNKCDKSLHTFCDASKLAYAAVVFLRTETSDGCTIQLLQAKSRVTPVKKITIPRLELLACCIGCRLAESVKNWLELKGMPMHFWTDSSTALGWIRRPEQWGTFVSNRVQEINQLSDTKAWRHVPGELNPADLPSRGCSVKQLINSRWWEGPAWLKLPFSEWPLSCPIGDEEEINSERKKTVIATVSITSSQCWYMKYFSSYTHILLMMAWIYRFINNARQATVKIKGELSQEELNASELQLWKVVQQETLKDGKALAPLQVFRDDQGLIRLKTQIILRQDTEDFRNPIVLPSRHPLTSALIREVHLKSCHAGLHVLLSILRERFWIIQGRRTVRKVISDCLQCKRHCNRKFEQIPVHLPEDRVKNAAIFEIVGVDLAGPLFLKGGDKAWIVLFTCAVYRAVHLELVTSMSTDAFLQALRRFISRRGRPAIIYSDNGTNFVGADHAFKSLDWKRITATALISRIIWKFNPPTAAWWGGWWERLIRLLKQLLRRVLGRASLQYEEMMTILCDCEAVINARPLTYLSEDPQDLTPLTPAMFLKDIPQHGVADLDLVETKSLRRRMLYRRKLRDELRQRFRKEYLGQLVQRAAVKKFTSSIQVGDVVLISADNRKAVDWPMARVTTIFPGKDGIVRVVRLKTASGEMLRPVQRLIPLEMSAREDFCGAETLPTSIRDKVTASPGTNAMPEYTASGRPTRKPERLGY